MVILKNPDLALRKDVRLLGTFWGDVISQQAGKSAFEMGKISSMNICWTGD